MIKLPSIRLNGAETNHRPTRRGAAREAAFTRQRRRNLAVTPLPADKHALARPRLSAPAEAGEIRKARGAAGDLSSRDGDWRRAAPSEEEISEGKKGPQVSERLHSLRGRGSAGTGATGADLYLRH